MAEEARIIIDAQLQFRHDTESNWLAADPILKVGEPAYTVGLSDRFKLGDGQRKWSELPYLQLNKSEGDEEAKGYTSLAWADIKNLTSGEETVLAQAFALNQAYQELKGIIPSLSDYYTKEEVNNLIPTVPDLSAYYTSGQVDQLLLQKASQSDFEALEEQVGELDGTVGQYSAAIATNARNITSLRSTVDGVSVGLDDLQESFNELDTFVSTIPTTYATIKALEDEAAARELWQTGINNRLGDVESDVENIWNDYVNRAELKKALEDLGVSGIATRLNAVEQAVGEFYGYLPGDIMEGDILATRTWVEGKNYATSADLSAYLQKSIWDSIFEIKTTESGSTYISVKGGLVADWMTFGSEAENTGGGGGQSYSQRNWQYIQTMTQDVAGDLASAYAVKQAYQELRSLASEVSFAQTQTSGTLIGVITIDGVAQNIYAPAAASAVDWSAITGKPTTLSGYGITDKVAYRETWNNFIHDSNEFTFVSAAYSGYVWLNYRTASGGSDGAITEYRFATGAGTSYAALRASSYIVNGGTSSQFLKADGGLDSTAYLPTSGGTISANAAIPLYVKGTSSQTGIILGENKAQVGWGWVNNTIGNSHYLYNYASGHYLGVSDSGVPHFDSNTLIHSGNIGSQSVNSATKLATPRTIWGQSFDGTGNISTMTAGRMPWLYFSNEDDTAGGYIGQGSGGSRDLLIYPVTGYNIRMYSSDIERMRISSSGNVLIGTTEDSGYALNVKGDIAGHNIYALTGHATLQGVSGISYTTYLDNRNQYGLKIHYSNGVAGAFFSQDGYTLIYGDLRIDGVTSSQTYKYSGISQQLPDVNADSWYTIYSYRGDDGDSATITITNNYYHQRSNAVTLLVNTGWSSDATITQLAYTGLGSFAVTEARVRYMGGVHYVDVRIYNVAYATDKFTVFGTGKGNFNAPVKVTDASGIVTSLTLAKNSMVLDGNLSATGTIHSSTGIWTEGILSFSDLSSTSDRRYKKDIKAISTADALRVIKALKPCTWEWNERAAVKGESAGFIAQEVMPVLPAAIKTMGEGDSEHLTLNYQMLHGYEVRVLQKHDDELTRLRGRLKKADRRIDFLEQEVERLKSRAS